MSRRVAVTGMGVVTSLSHNVEDLWSRVLAGESGIHKIQLIDTSKFKVTIGGDVHNWDTSGYIDHRESKRIDRFSQFAIAAATDAVNQSGIDFEKEDPYRCACIVGSGIGGMNTVEEQCQRLLEKGPARVSPMTIPKIMLNAAGGNISIKYGLKGACYSVATACASAANAIGDGFNFIRSGNSDVVITGGTEAALTKMGLSAFQNMKALSTRNDEPTRASRPFDIDRDGFVFSEGAGMLVFEEMEHAKARGAHIFCEVIGFGTSSDAGHITQPDGEGKGASKAMGLAIADANIGPESVCYINAHGTSTPLGDKAETAAMKSVLGKHAYNVSISSTKSSLGHSLGASGGIEFILSAKAVSTNVVPPTINLENADPDCDLDYTPLHPKEKQLRVAMSNSFGFGGHNASVILKSMD